MTVKLFLKTNAEVDMTRGTGTLFQHFTTRKENFVTFASKSVWSLKHSEELAYQPTSGWGLGEIRRTKENYTFKILNTRMKSARRRLRFSEKKLNWRSLFSYGTWRKTLTSRVASRWTLSALRFAELASIAHNGAVQWDTSTWGHINKFSVVLTEGHVQNISKQSMD